MKVCVRYTGQLRQLAGGEELLVDVAERSSVGGLLAELAARQPAIAGHLLTSSQDVQPSLLVAVNGAALSAREADRRLLADGDVVTLLPPIAGG